MCFSNTSIDCCGPITDFEYTSIFCVPAVLELISQFYFNNSFPCGLSLFRLKDANPRDFSMVSLCLIDWMT